MRIALYLAHPSQYYVLKNIRKRLLLKGHTLEVFIKSKDILEQLLKEDSVPFINIYPKVKGKGLLNLFVSVLVKNYRLYKYLKLFKIDMVVSAASDISQATYIKGISSIIFNDDDAHIIPKSSIFGWPLSSVILAPNSCNMGKWEKKTIKFNAFQKTAYLHPSCFKPDKEILGKYNLINKSYFIIRSVSLTAHHDTNIQGLSNVIVKNIIGILENFGEIIISSERKLSDDLDKYRKSIKVTDMHSLLYYSDLLIADSQSMCHEAALLGVPSIRYNDFVGRIGVLNQLEQMGLAIGVKPPDSDQLYNKIKYIIGNPGFRENLRNKSKKLVSDQIDLSSFSVWFIENYPESKRIMKETPDYQYNFR